MEGAFDISECLDRLKVTYAASLLKSRAKEWWDVQKQTMGIEVVNGMS